MQKCLYLGQDLSFCCFPQRDKKDFGGCYNLCVSVKIFVEIPTKREYTVCVGKKREGFRFFPQKKRKKADVQGYIPIWLEEAAGKTEY